MLGDFGQLALGLVLLLGGGDAVVRGAASLAKQLGVPPLVVGLTVVAFGTSAPELSVNVAAALRGNEAIAFGNLVGSNLANIGLILACGALLQTLKVQSVVVARELPMMLLASLAAIVVSADGLRGHSDAVIDRPDGFLLLLFFAVFLYYTVAETLRRRATDPFVEQVRDQEIGTRWRSVAPSLFLLAGGLAALVLGGRFTVAGAVDLATALEVPSALVGLTVVAVGTSLPELSTTLAAARRGETDLAVGNVVGSNIFNLLFVLGVTASIAPVPVPEAGFWDLAVMLGFGTALLGLSLGRGEVGRPAGVVFLGAYWLHIVLRAS